MPEEKNGSSKSLGQVLAILALMAGFTGLFVPIKQYVDRQAELEKELSELKQRITKLETLVDVYQTWPKTPAKQ